MPLELRTGRNGKLRTDWYGRYEAHGKRYTINLGVRVAGTPPGSLSLREQGDAAFERSRTQALARLEQVIAEARQRQSSAHLVERLYEIKTGEPIKSVKLCDLAGAWAKIPRRRQPDARYASQCRSALTRFTTFVSGHSPNAEEIVEVSWQAARAFMDAEAERGVTAKTWNDTLKLLRATFKHLMPRGGANPFSEIPTREIETVFRKPFTPDELKAIADAASGDDFIRPVIITGMCTAMRRGDCCLLRWQEVDLERGFITVKTSKTGVTVDIPIFPMLHDELTRQRQSPAPATSAGEPAGSPGQDAGAEGHVFPGPAAMYLENPDGITWRVRKVFSAAGFRDPDDDEQEGTADGQEATPSRGEIHALRSGGLRRASVRDFHSFRVTWVTLALTAGVPLELVQRVTGHKTTDIVLKHYFRPGREEFRQALQSAMPALLTNGHLHAATEDAPSRTPQAEVRDVLEHMTADTWEADRDRLLRLLAPEA